MIGIVDVEIAKVEVDFVAIKPNIRGISFDGWIKIGKSCQEKPSFSNWEAIMFFAGWGTRPAWIVCGNVKGKFTSRFWNIYSALKYWSLDDCRPQRNQLMQLCIKQLPIQKYLVFGIDHTPWPRPDAKTLKDREYGNAKWVLASELVRGEFGLTDIPLQPSNSHPPDCRVFANCSLAWPASVPLFRCSGSETSWVNT